MLCLLLGGGYSQIAAEINLLKKAYEVGSPCYYHFLTGVDLPLKSIKEINNFFGLSNQRETVRR